jgi:hypothetical protein
MKTTSLICPYSTVFATVKLIVRRKGYSITSAIEEEGIITAIKPGSLFRKKMNLSLKVFKIAQHITGVELRVNKTNLKRPLYISEPEEDRLLSSIYKHF